MPPVSGCVFKARRRYARFNFRSSVASESDSPKTLAAFEFPSPVRISLRTDTGKPGPPPLLLLLRRRRRNTTNVLRLLARWCWCSKKVPPNLWVLLLPKSNVSSRLTFPLPPPPLLPLRKKWGQVLLSRVKVGVVALLALAAQRDGGGVVVHIARTLGHTNFCTHHHRRFSGKTERGGKNTIYTPNE